MSHGNHDHQPSSGDAHDADNGGHEIDQMPNGRLFNLLFGLSGVTLVACIGVIQIFNRQVDHLTQDRATTQRFQLADYEAQMKAAGDSWGQVSVKEQDGSVTQRFHMPLANARRAVLEDPTRLRAEAAPPQWKTADDQAPAPTGQPAAPAPTAVPVGAVVPTHR